MAGTSYRLDETDIKVGKQGTDLSRALDKAGHPSAFMLSAQRDIPAVKRFFKKMRRAAQRRLPRSISVEKHGSDPPALEVRQKEKVLPVDCKLAKDKGSDQYRSARPSICGQEVESACLAGGSFQTAERAVAGIEAMHMMHQGQVKNLGGRDAVGQVKFIESLCGIAA